MHDIMTTNHLDNRQDGRNKRPKSMLNYYRKIRAKKIMAENRKMAERLEKERGVYDKRDWEKHARDHRKFVENLREVRPRTKRRPKSATHKAAVTRRLKSDEEAIENVLFKQGCQLHELSDPNSTVFYVITIAEVKAPHHFTFRGYSLGDERAVKVDVAFDSIKSVTPPKLHMPEARQELAATLSSCLLLVDGRLKFDMQRCKDKFAAFFSTQVNVANALQPANISAVSPLLDSKHDEKNAFSNDTTSTSPPDQLEVNPVSNKKRSKSRGNQKKGKHGKRSKHGKHGKHKHRHGNRSSSTHSRQKK
jgi:hypothetical protein